MGLFKASIGGVLVTLVLFPLATVIANRVGSLAFLGESLSPIRATLIFFIMVLA